MKLTFSFLDGLYMDEKCLLIDVIKKYQLMKQSAAEFERLNRDKNERNKKKEDTSKPSPKKYCFVNKTTRTSLETSNTSNSNINVDIPKCSEASSSEEKDIQCRIKIHVETINYGIKRSISEEEEIGICKCRRRIRVGIMNKEVKGWISSSKQQEAPP